MNVKIVNKNEHYKPEYKSAGAAGIDLAASVQFMINPGQRVLVPTGVYLEIPEGYEGQVRPRSGLAIKDGITVLNSPGTIDSDYRGEVKVILINHSENTRYFKPGDRIAQLVFCKVERAELIEVEQLSETERGEGGFGHTGV